MQIDTAILDAWGGHSKLVLRVPWIGAGWSPSHLRGCHWGGPSNQMPYIAFTHLEMNISTFSLLMVMSNPPNFLSATATAQGSVTRRNLCLHVLVSPHHYQGPRNQTLARGSAHHLPGNTFIHTPTHPLSRNNSLHTLRRETANMQTKSSPHPKKSKISQATPWHSCI